MFPNLFQATKDYWRKLDKLEADYQQGKISLEVVNAMVAELMAELSQERRTALSGVWQIWQNWLVGRRETLVGLAIFVSVTYVWICLKVA